ncbi:alpha/beta hydrolase [Chryseobacterium sp. ISL-6]|uniref:alpha/beta fold hydrolase n=1 Tax=Chryseobacterium sp. ISL-6 TaxID=2819143 RepID=UPI001BE87EF5|nr:alpha/beta hydrolase [Chryseobacterium sp. ISL-6]MBT2623072.1 alpha/beta hydrolase [Chryseobacterium sp. ISL-6]
MKNLLLLHGALGHSDIFKPYQQELSKHFNIHTPLFSGHGNTDISEEDISIEKYTKELENYCEEENLKDVYIFGHSMGGYVGLCYALRKPDNVSSILTLGTKFDWTEEQAVRESKMLDPETILSKIPKYAEQLEAQHGSKWKQLLPAIAKMMISLGKNPPLDQSSLIAITTPVQIMVGDKDNMVTLEESIRVYHSIPNARLAVLPDTKHPMDKVRSTLVFDIMKDFWNLV